MQKKHWSREGLRWLPALVYGSLRDTQTDQEGDWMMDDIPRSSIVLVTSMLKNRWEIVGLNPDIGSRRVMEGS